VVARRPARCDVPRVPERSTNERTLAEECQRSRQEQAHSEYFICEIEQLRDEWTTATTIDEVRLPETTNVVTVLCGRRGISIAEAFEVK